MSVLWSHSFQHLSHPGVRPVVCARLGLGALMTFQMSNPNISVSSCITWIYRLVHQTMLEVFLTKSVLFGLCPQAAPSYCLTISLFLMAWCDHRAQPSLTGQVYGQSFLFFAPCGLIIPAQTAHSLCPWQKGHFEVGGWGLLGKERGVYRGTEARECNELFWEPQWWVMERACENHHQGGHLWLNMSVSLHTIVPFPISQLPP